MKLFGGHREFHQFAQFLLTGTIVWAFLITMLGLFYLALQRIELPSGLREVICIMVGMLAQVFGSVVSKWWAHKSDGKDNSQ